MIFLLKRGKIKKEKKTGGMRSVVCARFWAFVAGVKAVGWRRRTELCIRPCFVLSLPLASNTHKLTTVGVRFIVKFARTSSGGWTKGEKKV